MRMPAASMRWSTQGSVEAAVIAISRGRRGLEESSGKDSWDVVSSDAAENPGFTPCSFRACVIQPQKGSTVKLQHRGKQVGSNRIRLGPASHSQQDHKATEQEWKTPRGTRESRAVREVMLDREGLQILVKTLLLLFKVTSYTLYFK